MDNDLLTMKNFEEYIPLDSTESKKSSVFTGKQHMVNKSYCLIAHVVVNPTTI
jgi:hypothetical protein